MNSAHSSRFGAALASTLATVSLFAVSGCSNNYDRMAPRVPESSDAMTSQTRTTSAEVPVRDARPTRPRNDVAQPIRARDAAPLPTESTREWEARYPFPASELTRIAQRNRDASAALVEWERKDPEKSRALMGWVITHPYEEVSVFLINRPGWDEFNAMRAKYPGPIDDVLEWARHAPKAADELFTRATGFASLRERAGLNTL